MRRISVISLIATFVLSAGVASAGAGSLTSAEYQQLQAVHARLKNVRPTTLHGYRAMLWACEQIQMETPLLTTARAVCDDYAQMNITAAGIKRGVGLCVLRTHVLGARLNCIANVFSRMYRPVRGFYTSDASMLRIATSRHLGQPCTQFLAGTTDQLAYAQKLASVTAQMIAAGRRGSLASFVADGHLFSAVAKRLQVAMQADPSKLAWCAHQ